MDGGVRMRRSRALRRARWLSLLAAGIVGYAIGNWHAIALRAVGLTASQSIALRFPEPSDEPSPANAVPAAPLHVTNAIILGDTSAVLLSPAPMIASAVQKPFIQQAPASQTPPSQGQAPIRVASAGDVALPAAAPVASAAVTRRVPAPALEAKANTKVAAKPEVRTAGVAPRPEGKGEEGARPAKRRVFVLNDAQ